MIGLHGLPKSLGLCNCPGRRDTSPEEEVWALGFAAGSGNDLQQTCQGPFMRRLDDIAVLPRRGRGGGGADKQKTHRRPLPRHIGVSGYRRIMARRHFFCIGVSAGGAIGKEVDGGEEVTRHTRCRRISARALHRYTDTSRAATHQCTDSGVPHKWPTHSCGNQGPVNVGPRSVLCRRGFPECFIQCLRAGTE